jgi:hypothetical protein
MKRVTLASCVRILAYWLDTPALLSCYATAYSQEQDPVNIRALLRELLGSTPLPLSVPDERDPTIRSSSGEVLIRFECRQVARVDLPLLISGLKTLLVDKMMGAYSKAVSTSLPESDPSMPYWQALRAQLIKYPNRSVDDLMLWRGSCKGLQDWTTASWNCVAPDPVYVWVGEQRGHNRESEWVLRPVRCRGAVV